MLLKLPRTDWLEDVELGVSDAEEEAEDAELEEEEDVDEESLLFENDFEVGKLL